MGLTSFDPEFDHWFRDSTQFRGPFARPIFVQPTRHEMLA